MQELKMVSLFTGCGGLDYGFEAAGFETCVAIEIDSDCCSTIRANKPWNLIPNDIHDVSSEDILNAGKLHPGEVDLLVGGPPCQPFSKSAYWVNGDTKRLEDPRSNTLHAYMRCVEDILPRIFVLENVHGISYSGKEEGFHLLGKLTSHINAKHGTNYRLSWKVINVADYGVPQIRKRFFLVAHRDGKSFKFPIPTHAPETECKAGMQMAFGSRQVSPYATAWDAIGHMENESNGEDLRMRGQWAELLPSIPEGENYLWHTNRKGGLPLFGWRTRFWSFLLKLAKNLPSWTIQAQPGPAIGPFHWKNRLLSVREMAALQTFPDQIRIVGGRVSIQRQIGNAVPSLISEVLGRDIARQFFGKRYTQAPKFAVPLRRPIPPAESVLPVPEKFLDLIGDHRDHPGEGKKRASMGRTR